MPQIQNPQIAEEIETLESIYGDELVREATTTAWKGAQSLPSFTLLVSSEDPDLKPHVFFTLHVVYTRTYPAAPATFTIKTPLSGLDTDQIKKLTNRIRNMARDSSRANEVMVFDIATECARWITATNNYNPHISQPEEKQPTLSLAAQMKARDEQKVQELQEMAEKEAERLRKEQLEHAERLAEEIKLEEQKREHRLRAEREKKKAKEDLLETEMTDDPMVEHFGHKICFSPGGPSFDTVRLGSARSDIIGSFFLVDPVMDNIAMHQPVLLELHSILFNTPFYSHSQGKKRLRDVEQELQDLVSLRHPNLVSFYAAELKEKTGSQHPKSQVLNVLTERIPSMSLQDVLEHCERISPEKALNYTIQILDGLEALHDFRSRAGHDRLKLSHKSITASSISLVRSTTSRGEMRLKISRTSYYTRLLELYRSNPFTGSVRILDRPNIPIQWRSPDMEHAPSLYTQQRDIWDVGVLLLQMILGLNVMEMYPTVGDAIEALDTFSIAQSARAAITSIFEQSKKTNLTCTQLILKLKQVDSTTPVGGLTISVPFSPKTPLGPSRRSTDHFPGLLASAQGPRMASRWKDEWEEIEFLGKGGFGSVVKARFKLDGAIYAVKKVKLRRENDGKIFREANALSRLSHRFIVRYHTVWVETMGMTSGLESPLDSDSFDSVDYSGSHHHSRSARDNALLARPGQPLFRKTSDFSIRTSFSSTSIPPITFPSIHFGRDEDDSSSDDEPIHQTRFADVEDSDDEEASDTTSQGSGTPSSSVVGTPRTRARTPSSRRLSPAPWAPQMLYMQMEFVERQTLKEAIEEGLSEKEAWRLFRQLLEALAHIASLGIIHRDIKLTNIFIGANGDVKIGDFGLATSSLAQVDPSDVSDAPQSVEMTSGVGTALYLAPEVLARARGHASHAKADMYALGIVFFEMNWPPFETSTERIHVIQRLRLPSITFPETWENKEKQRTIITRLLQHNPAARPSALELSNSNLLPEQEEDAYFEEARRKIHNSEEQCELFVAELFQKRFDDVKQLSYDADAKPPEHTSLNDIVQEHVTRLFQLHGAVHKEPLLLVPLTDLYDDEQQPVNLLDSAGRAVSLPRDHIVPFARSVISAKDNRSAVRVKRFHIGNVYQPSVTAKQPTASLMAALDIIHTDVVAGAAEAELLRIVSECINLFPGVNAQQFDIYISQSTLVETVFNRTHMDRERRRDLSVILNQPKPWSQKKTHLLKLGFPRVMTDELEILSEDIAIDDVLSVTERLEKVGGPNAMVRQAMDDVVRTIKLAQLMGVRKPIVFRPLIMINEPHFREGIMFEVRGSKKVADVLARGGRYDHLITKFAGVTPKAMRAVGVQIALATLTASLADHLSVTVPRLIKEHRSFGYWSPSRCDVYIVSFQPGLMAERIELASLLWSNGVSADIMYESALDSGDATTYAEMCTREGILFMVWYRPKTARRDHSLYKVKSLLRGTEAEVTPQDLVSYLQSQIAEQRRTDQTTAGGISSSTLISSSSSHHVATPRDTSSSGPDVQVIVGGDAHKKHQRNKMKVQFAEKAYTMESDLRSSFTSGLPIISVELSGKAIDILTSPASSAWLTSDAVYKSLLNEHKEELPNAIMQPLREALLKRKHVDGEGSGTGGGGGQRMVGLMSVREDRLWIFKV